MESLSWHSSGLVQGLTNSHVGLQSDAICWDFNAPDAIPGVIGGCRFYSATTESGLTGPIAYAKRVVSGFGTSLKQGVRNSFGHAVNIGAIGEFLPNSGSYVDLDPEKKNKYGIPYARIHSRLGDAEIKRLRFMAETCRKLLMEAGAEIFEEYGTYDSFSASHVFGTCRMGKDAAISVVNRDSKCHDIDNLYIVDASIFPSSGGGESPSLTIQALAVRAMDKIV
jgi:choline dehydrogenase-like flavoprotein